MRGTQLPHMSAKLHVGTHPCHTENWSTLGEGCACCATLSCFFLPEVALHGSEHGTTEDLIIPRSKSSNSTPQEISGLQVRAVWLGRGSPLCLCTNRHVHTRTLTYLHAHQHTHILLRARSKLSAYYWARVGADLPLELALPTMFVIIVYWFGGLRATAGAMHVCGGACVRAPHAFAGACRDL